MVFADAIPIDQEATLAVMRRTMRSQSDLVAAVLVGGMDGVETDLALFQHFYPGGLVLPVAAAEGATRDRATRFAGAKPPGPDDIDFARLFHRELDVHVLPQRPKRSVRVMSFVADLEQLGKRLDQL